MFRQSPHVSILGHVPQPQRAVRPADQPFSVRTETDRVDPLTMSIQSLQLFARSHLPHAHRFVVPIPPSTPASQQRPVGTETDRIHRAAMSFQSSQFPASVCVPDQDRAVKRPAGQPPPIRAETDRRHGTAVALQSLQFPARRRVPDSYRPERRPAGQPPAVRTDNHRAGMRRSLPDPFLDLRNLFRMSQQGRRGIGGPSNAGTDRLENESNADSRMADKGHSGLPGRYPTI